MTRLLLGLFLVLALGCSSIGIPWTSSPGPYDELAEAELLALSAARDAFDDGEPAAAHRALSDLLASRPRNLPAATLRQEVELAWLLAGGAPPGLAALPAELTGPPAVKEAQARIASAYLARARAAPTAEALVLAARMEGDVEVSLSLLAEALDMDRDCIWAQYGRAYVFFGAGRLRESRESLDQALLLDGGHLPARRLHAALLARSGSSQVAIGELENWLAAADGSPVLARRRIAEAHVDLAGLHVQAGAAEEALEILGVVERWRLQSPARAELVEAAAWHELGRTDAALEASRRAAVYAPAELLPLLQQALLVQASKAEDSARIEAWEALLEVADREAPEGAPAAGLEEGLEWLLVRLQAHAWIERLRARVESADESTP